MDTEITAEMAHDLLKYVADNAHHLELTDSEMSDLTNLACKVILELGDRYFNGHTQSINAVIEDLFKGMIKHVLKQEKLKRQLPLPENKSPS